jgi:hypothetical protein
MGEQTDGGPAFPGEHWNQTWGPGMSLRDYFAAAALTGQIADGTAKGPEIESRWAYQYADAMLAERAKPRAEEPPR